MPIYNKVIADGKTLIDLSQDTVTQASHIVSPYVAHLRDGTQVTGTAIVASEPNLQTKTNISPTTSSQTITADSGYDGLSSVQINAMPSGTTGTPSVSKGTVSNHSVSVTPSVTNTTGYITGGTKTGTAVTVTASELASGNKEITSNGTDIDVVGYSTVSVSVKSKKYIAKIVVTGSAATGRSARYDNVTYYKTDDTFTYNDGDTVILRAVDTYGGAGYIKIDGVIVTSGQPPVSYSYTLPDHDIIIETISSSGTVSVTNASSLNLQEKTNISPTESSQTIIADSGYDGLSSVQINAMPTMTLPTSASSSSSGTSKATIGRSTSAQYINIPTGYNGTASYYTISATPNGSATTPATTITANPTITVSSSGLITATASASQNITLCLG